ncbi:MAG: YbhB/YbcL family Raf kinase inhibitor-like protein [Pseudomonadota bacterium]
MAQHSFTRFAPTLALIALAGCGAGDDSTGASHGGTAVENATLTKIALTSSAFQNGGPIPAQYSCDGTNQSPPLSWGEPPPGTKSFALVVDDPDAPTGIFRHWGAYDIPASTRSIAAGQAVGTQAVNDLGKPGYGGPCPPKGHGPHHYRFKLFALGVDSLGLPANAKAADVESAAEGHALGRAELIGTYERR